MSPAIAMPPGSAFLNKSKTFKMESHNTSCSICLMSYNEKERRPLVLPCCHSFCQACLEHLERDDNKTCSYCRKYWGSSDVSDLICCLQLLPDDDTTTKDHRAPPKCAEHNTELSMWCDSCSESICVKCLSLKHKKCNWMLLEDEQENSTAVYEVAVSHLVEMASRSGDVIAGLDSFEKRLQNFRDKLRWWQQDVEHELAECPTAHAGDGAKRDRGEFKEKLNALVTKQMELSDTASIFLSHLEDACQVGESGTSPSLRGQLQRLTETPLLTEVCSSNTVSVAMNKSASSRKKANSVPTSYEGQAVIFEGLETTSNAFQSFFSADDTGSADSLVYPRSLSTDGHLVVKDTSEISKVCSTLQSSTSSKLLIIEGSSWKEPEFTKLLNVVTQSCCQVSLKTMDTFWQPSSSASSTKNAVSLPFVKSVPAEGNRLSRRPQSRSMFATRARLDALIKPGFRCTLTEFWGHLDAEGLQRLPKSIRVLGLALADKEDLATLRQVLETDGGTWSLTADFNFLTKLHLSFARSLQAKDFKVNEGNVDSSKSQWRRGTDVALHFFRVDAASLDWMQHLMMLFAKKCSVSDVFLPEAWFTPYSGMAAFKDDSISLIRVHLPLDLKMDGALGTLGECMVQWDM